MTFEEIIKEMRELKESGLLSEGWKVHSRYCGYKDEVPLSAKLIIEIEKEWNPEQDNLGGTCVTGTEPLRGEMTMPDAYLCWLARKLVETI